MKIPVFFFGVILFASACINEAGIDKTKFAELYKTAQEIKTAIQSNNRCGAPDSLAERLASGTAALRDKTVSKPERDLLAAYADLLAIYQDGLLLCRSRGTLSGFQFVPRDRIYVTQELDPIIEKYGLPVERHVYKRTGTYMKSIPGDSIAKIWESAGAEIRNIENMVNYN